MNVEEVKRISEVSKKERWRKPEFIITSLIWLTVR